MDTYTAARVDAQNNVVNIEVVTDEYVAFMASRTTDRFIPYTDSDEPPHTGYAYNPDADTFEQPPEQVPLVPMDTPPLPEAFTS